MNDRELLLAIACCRAAYGSAAVEIEHVEPNWGRFLHLARRHRVQALAWHGLGAWQARVPAEIAELFRDEAQAIVEANLLVLAESNRLFGLFHGAGVPMLFVKGLTLAALAYPNPFLKMGWDIDVLVGPDDLLPAARLLRSAGYGPVIPGSVSDQDLQRWHGRRKESVWHCAMNDTYLDLHTRLSDNAALLPEVDIGSRSRTVTVAQGVSLPTLGPDELFAYLCVHGASSAWFRLKWIADLAGLIHREPVEELERLHDRSQELGAGRAAAQALLVARRMFGVDLGAQLKRRLDRDRINGWLAAIATRQIANPREPTARPMGTATIHLSQPFLLRGPRFALSELARQMRDWVGARVG